jgi:hypothetical protein
MKLLTQLHVATALFVSLVAIDSVALAENNTTENTDLRAGAEAGTAAFQVSAVESAGDSDCVYADVCGSAGWRGSCFFGVCSCESWAQCYDANNQPTSTILSCGHYVSTGGCEP